MEERHVQKKKWRSDQGTLFYFRHKNIEIKYKNTHFRNYSNTEKAHFPNCGQSKNLQTVSKQCNDFNAQPDITPGPYGT